MKSLLTSVSRPVWADENKTSIDCVITTSQFGEEELPFTASENDIEEHGRRIFADIVAGVYGTIGDYVPPAVVEPIATVTAPSGSLPLEIL